VPRDRKHVNVVVRVSCVVSCTPHTPEHPPNHSPQAGNRNFGLPHGFAAAGEKRRSLAAHLSGWRNTYTGACAGNMADANGGNHADSEANAVTLVSSASTQLSEPVVQAPTAAILGKQITSGSTGGGSQRTASSAKSTQSALSDRRRRKALADSAPRPWPDDRLYNKRSLFLFNLQSPVRQIAIRMIEWPWWDRKVLIVILMNTCMLAMYDAFDTPDMRACNPAELNIPAGPYGYCNKMGTGTSLPPAVCQFSFSPVLTPYLLPHCLTFWSSSSKG